MKKGTRRTCEGGGRSSTLVWELRVELEGNSLRDDANGIGHIYIETISAFWPYIFDHVVACSLPPRGSYRRNISLGGNSASGVAHTRQPLDNINTPLHGRRAEAFDMSVDGAYLTVVGG